GRHRPRLQGQGRGLPGVPPGRPQARIRVHPALQLRVRAAPRDQREEPDRDARALERNLQEAYRLTRTDPMATTPRTFKLVSPHMTGPDIRDFQRDLAGRFASWHIDKPVLDDGDYGSGTR